MIHLDASRGPREVARHRLTTPGRAAINDEHYPPRPAGALERTPRARSADERAFLQIGPAAERWLIRAAAAGASRVRRKMAEAVDLAKPHGTDEVERALATCTDAGRFGDGDLAAILAHQQSTGELILFPARSGERSLQRSTRSWEGFGGSRGECFHDLGALRPDDSYGDRALVRIEPDRRRGARSVRPDPGVRSTSGGVL